MWQAQELMIVFAEHQRMNDEAQFYEQKVGIIVASELLYTTVVL